MLDLQPDLQSAASPPPAPHRPTLRELAGRSLFPLVALLLLAAVPLVGPWIFTVLVFAWWRVVTWIG